MTKWIIRPSYKFDLASICNLYAGQKEYEQAHPQARDRYQSLISNHPELKQTAGALNEQGFLVSSALIAIFDSHDYQGEDIDQICNVAEDPHLREDVLRPYFLDNKVLTRTQWQQYSPMLPALTGLARLLHNNGFLEYWRKDCLPKIKEHCQKLQEQSIKYPILQAVNRLLGSMYARNKETISLYLGKFAAPYGTSLVDQGFVADIRWDMGSIAAIALHEMMHPPFDRDKLKTIGEELQADDLVKEARNLLPPYHYPSPGLFLEENVVEGAHVFLAERMGIMDQPLQYFTKHDRGSHVISVLVYDALKQGMADEGLTLEQVIDRLVARGDLRPGAVRNAYMAIYKQANLAGIIPCQ